MFTPPLFIIVKTWKQSRCLSVGEIFQDMNFRNLDNLLLSCQISNAFNAFFRTISDSAIMFALTIKHNLENQEEESLLYYLPIFPLTVFFFSILIFQGFFLLSFSV